MSPLRIGIICDWARSARGNRWPDVLARIAQDWQIPNQPTLFPLADLIVAPPQAGGLQTIRAQDVLIVNWDAANGNPDFGGHLALRWIEHRQPELILWVRAGGILIVESQTVYGIAAQHAYDAVTGRNELPVSGPESPDNPLLIRARLGARCRKTGQFPTRGGFEDVDDELDVAAPISHEILFPATSTTLLTGQIKDLDHGRQLYRGWFRRVLPGLRAYPWVSLLQTSDRGRGREQSVMQVATIGDGAIFATTLMLSMAEQYRLIAAILKCAGQHTDHLPRPQSIIETVRNFWTKALTALAGAASGLIAASATRWVDALSHWLGPHAVSPDHDQLKTWIKAGFVPAGILLFALARWTVIRLRKRVRAFIGS